ncbi:MAG: hypothetical protein U1E45_16990 [Geminicoccaceae bacterium]
MGILATILLLCVGAGVAAFARWHEGRPRELGDVSLVPSHMLLGLGIIVAVLAAAHLVSLLTGHPLTSRYLHLPD